MSTRGKEPSQTYRTWFTQLCAYLHASVDCRTNVMVYACNQFKQVYICGGVVGGREPGNEARAGVKLAFCIQSCGENVGAEALGHVGSSFIAIVFLRFSSRTTREGKRQRW